MPGTTTRNRREDDREFVVTRDIIAASVPQDKDHCAMAIGIAASGLDGVSIAYDLTSGEVYAVWQEPEANRLRNYQGFVEPFQRAMQILMGTDLDRKRLIRLCPPGGWTLRITRCDSRFQQPGQRGMPRPVRNGSRGTSMNRRPRRISARASRTAA